MLQTKWNRRGYNRIKSGGLKSEQSYDIINFFEYVILDGLLKIMKMPFFV